MTDTSKEQTKMTAGLDLGDKYSYLCMLDTESGEVIEESRLRTTPQALRRRFFAAGAMVYVVAREIIPEVQSHGNERVATLGVLVGLLIMLSLDIALG